MLRLCTRRGARCTARVFARPTFVATRSFAAANEEVHRPHNRNPSNRFDDLEDYVDEVLNEQIKADPSFDPSPEEFEALEGEAMARWATANGYDVTAINHKEATEDEDGEEVRKPANATVCSFVYLLACLLMCYLLTCSAWPPFRPCDARLLTLPAVSVYVYCVQAGTPPEDLLFEHAFDNYQDYEAMYQKCVHRPPLRRLALCLVSVNAATNRHLTAFHVTSSPFPLTCVPVMPPQLAG